MVAPLRLRKIKEKSPTPWYNEHSRALKRTAGKMEHSWRKTKLEVFRLAWRESTLSNRKALKLLDLISAASSSSFFKFVSLITCASNKLSSHSQQ